MERCTRCSQVGHVYKRCMVPDTDNKCKNCNGSHRTFLAACPIQKKYIKDRGAEIRKKKRLAQRRTYAGVAGGQEPSGPEPPTGSLPLSTDGLASHIYTDLICGMMEELVTPGSLQKTVDEAFDLNNIPKTKLPKLSRDKIMAKLNSTPFQTTASVDPSTVFQTPTTVPGGSGEGGAAATGASGTSTDIPETKDSAPSMPTVFPETERRAWRGVPLLKGPGPTIAQGLYLVGHKSPSQNKRKTPNPKGDQDWRNHLNNLSNQNLKGSKNLRGDSH